MALRVVNELVRTTTQEKSKREIQMNNSSNLLVLGATGQVGKLVANNLKGRNANFSVGSRWESKLGTLADQFGASRFIDLDDPRTFDKALENVTGIFLITGYTVDMLVQSKSLIDAARRNGVNHIVHLGAFTTDQGSYSTVFAWHQMIDAYLRNSGVAWTNLHPNLPSRPVTPWQKVKFCRRLPGVSRRIVCVTPEKP
jgi:NAD(P)H dehydrogenase (quinone)